MNLWKTVRDYGISTLLIAFGALLEYLTFNTKALPLWIVGIVVIFVGVLQLADKILSNNDFTSIKRQLSEDMATLKKSNEEQAKVNEEQKKTSDEQLKLIKNLNEDFNKQDAKHKAKIKLVSKLIDNGLISEEDAIKNLDGIDAYILYCYPTPSPLSNKDNIIPRTYPTFLKEAGFIRLGRTGLFYITTKNRLTKRLHNANTLKQWLLKELDKQLKIEWEEQLKILKSKSDPLYKKYESQKYSDNMSMNILIFKTKLRSGNIGIVNKDILPRAFKNLLGTDFKTDKIQKLDEEKKIEIRKFVFDSSFQLFFAGEVFPEDLRKLLKLEPALKQKLKINSFIDYTKKSEDEIKGVFESSFNQGKATTYSKLLKTKVVEYEDALKEMGISTA